MTEAKQDARNAASQRKRRETSIHRVIDQHRPGKNDQACMEEIKRILGRKAG